MSRTSKALKRLGVAGVAVATIGAGIPAFFATAASATHTGNTATAVSLSPDADSAPTGTCNQFTATVTFSNQADSATLDVQAAPRAGDQNVDFCELSSDGTTSNAPGGTSTAVGGVGAVEKREYVVTAPAGSNTGTVTFGVISQQAGVVDVTAFLEGTTGSTGAANNTPDGNEPRDTSVKTFTAGGNQAVTALDAEPESAVNVQGDTHTFTARLTQSDGSPVPDATLVKFDVTAGPDAAINVTPCTAAPQGGTTNQAGTVSCSFTNAGGPGTDTIVVFLDRDNDNVNDGAATEPQDEISKTFQAPQAAGTTVEMTCESTRTNTAGDQCVNPVTEKTEKFTATVKTAAGAPVSGAAVSFAITNQSGDVNTPDPAQGTTANPDVESITPTSCLTDANGQCSTTLTNPRVAEGETVTVRARIVTGPGSINVDDSATKTWRTPTAVEARNLVLTPPTQNSATPGVATLTATVTDRLGQPVKGVGISFSENGTGRFVTGSSTFFAVTDAAGKATAELQTVQGDPAGTNTVTAAITSFDTNGDGFVDTARGTGTSDDECEKAATATNSPAGNAPGQTAGDCDDTATVTFGPSASPTATATATATPPGCDVARQNLPFTINDSDRTVRATAPVTVTVTGARPGDVIELQAYQQNHFGTANFANAGNTRTAIADGNGAATFTLRFSSNARMRAKVQGCAFGANAGFDRPGQGNVLYVSVALFMNVQRVGVRTYVISGDSIPARPGGLIVNIYCTDPRCKNPQNPSGIIAQPRARADNGEYRSNLVRFSAAFQGSRVNILALLRGDAQNVAGQSNVRSLLIG